MSTTIAKSRTEVTRDSSGLTRLFGHTVVSWPRASFCILLMLFSCGLVVRFLGIRLGLPYIHHWDECWVVWNTRNMLETASNRPTTFQYGAPLSSLMAWTVRIANGLPWVHPISYGDEVGLRWIGRAVSIVLCSSGTVALYLAGTNVVPSPGNSRRLGLYCAATYAFGYELVTHARYAVTDGILVGCCAWAIATGALYLRTERLRWAWASLFCAATAFGFKFTALPTVTIPILCIIVTLWRRNLRTRIAYWAIVVGALPIVPLWFLALNPHFIDSWHQATRDLAQRIAQTRNGGFSLCYLHEPGIDHLSRVLWALFGHTLSRWVPLACVLSATSAIGIGWACRRGSKIVFISAIHAAIVVLGLALSVRTLVLRNYLTAVPVMCLGVGIGLETLSTRAARCRLIGKARPWLGVSAAYLLVFLLGAATTIDCIANQRLSRDSRERAIDWIRDHSHGRLTSVSITPSTIASLLPVGSNALGALKRPTLHFVRQSSSCEDLKRTLPDYVVSASYRGPDVPTTPFDERWNFTKCEGYREVARFDANPYEATLWVYPTWLGRVSTIVMARR